MRFDNLYVVGCGGVYYYASSAVAALTATRKATFIDPDTVSDSNGTRQWGGVSPGVPKVICAAAKYASECPRGETITFDPLMVPVEQFLSSEKLTERGLSLWLLLTDNGASRALTIKFLESEAPRPWVCITGGNDPKSSWASMLIARTPGHQLEAQANEVRQGVYAKIADVLTPDTETEHRAAHQCGTAQTITSNLMSAALIGRLLTELVPANQGKGGIPSLVFWDRDSSLIWEEKRPRYQTLNNPQEAAA